MKPVRKLTLTAILSALGVGLLYLGSLLPTLQIPGAAAAALVIAVVVIHCGMWWAAGALAVTGGLALLLLLDKGPALWFVTTFGTYALVKALIEGLNKRWLEWLLKLMFFAAALAVMILVFQTTFQSALPQWQPMLLYGALLAAFLAYDVACTGLITFYLRRIRPHIK